MGVIIFNSQNEEDYVSCNWWNWRPTVELIRKTNLFNTETCDLLSSGFGDISEEQTIIIVKFLEELLSDADADSRFLLNTEKTNEPDDFVFHKDDFTKNYSATAPWLRTFVDFLKKSEGIRVS
ncbi:MAG: hypothetical protein QNK23_03870 [Crocinitomicaceae bacterium]|nr:hypothetical protein [Crocinitomicaceae bacterium]